jgi:hypothetical protein
MQAPVLLRTKESLTRSKRLAARQMDSAMAAPHHVLVALDARLACLTPRHGSRIGTHDEIDRRKNDDDQQYLCQSIAPLMPLAEDGPRRAGFSIGRADYPMAGR